MKRLAVLALLVITAAGAAPQANATKKGWHRCQLSMEGGLGSLCDGRGRVLFPWVGDVHARGSYAQIVRGFRRTSSRSAVVDTHADWGGIQGDCGPIIKDCKDWVAKEQIRYRTSDGGRHWRVVSFHRQVWRYEGPGPGPPVQTGFVDDHPPLEPCRWSHTVFQHELADPVRLYRSGTWCAPPDEWTMPDSLKP